jgi:hypothetical protein
MDDDFIEAINATADTSFDAGVPVQLIDANVPTNCNGDPITCPVVLGLLAKPRFFERRSGSATTGFIDGEYRSGESEVRPMYLGPPSGRAPTAEEKRGAYHLQTEYLEGRLGKNTEENSRLWNTAIWIDRLNRIATTPAEALPPLNIYAGDKISQSTEGTGAPTGPDDEASDKAGNEGVEFESITVDANSESDARWWKRLPDGSMCAMDEDGTTRRLDIKTDDYGLLRLIDAIKDIDDLANIDVNDLMRESPPLLPQTDFPDALDRAEAGKILRMLKLGMRSLWRPVIRAIADQATMTSLGKTLNGVAATVGRTRVIEGLRIAESIRKGLTRQERPFSMWQNQIRARQIPIQKPGLTVARRQASVDEIIKAVIVATTPVISMPMIGDYEPIEIWQDNDSDTATRSSTTVAALPMPVRATKGHYLNLAAGPVIKLPGNPLPANDNHCANAAANEAA